MGLNNLLLSLFIIGLFILALYDEIILPRRKGKTLLAIALLRRNRIDGYIIAGLLLILLWQNITSQGDLLSRWLLGVLFVLVIYLAGLRQPKIIFKPGGFFFARRWYTYQQIQAMNLSEDGVLVMDMQPRRLLIRVRQIDDLEKIYNLLIETQ